MKNDDTVGAPLPRIDGHDKVTGLARYASDVTLEGMLHARALRSNVPHGRIRHIDASIALDMPGVHAVLTRDNLGNVKPTGWLIKDQPIVATEKVRYIGEVLAVVAAETPAQSAAAAKRIDVEIDPIEPVTDLRTADATAPPLFDEQPMGAAPTCGDGSRAALFPRQNVCFEYEYGFGPDSVWSSCDAIFEDEFEFSRMHHVHLEPFVSVARVDGATIEVWTSTQNPFPLRKELARIFDHPENRLRVHAPLVGGAFGAKHNCRTEPIAIRLAQLSGRPVRWSLTAEEGFYTNSQHAACVAMRTGIRGGRLVARETTIRLDSGAYSDGSPLVAEKAAYRAAGPYRWEHVKSTCSCILTTTVPAGAFRGFGGPQVIWAGESQIDMIARRLGRDPFEFRIANLLPLGAEYAPGDTPIDSDLSAGLQQVYDSLDAAESTVDHRRGIGVAIGAKDGGGVNKPAQARVKISTHGHVYLECGTVEIGQGALTSMVQIVAELLGVSPAKVACTSIDTDSSPFDHGTNSSSGVAVMGRAVEDAALSVKDEVMRFASGELRIPSDELELQDWHILHGGTRTPLAELITRTFGATGFEFTGQGFFKVPQDPRAPFGVPCPFWEVGWAAAAVTVDTRTGDVSVDQLVVSSDAGRAINPLTCRGQDEGSAIMAYAQALFEYLDHDGPVLRNADLLEYRVPLASDLPPRFASILQEQGRGPGPFGAKGVGEAAMLPVAAAIANAVHDATGVRVQELPLDPLRVLAALAAAGQR